MSRVSRLLLAIGLSLAAALPASAQEYVQAVSIEFDPVAYLSEARGVAFVTGTLTCDADGELFNLEVDMRQGNEFGYTNEDLAGFQCTDEGSPFLLHVENEEAWRPGVARVVRLLYAEWLPTGQRIILRTR